MKKIIEKIRELLRSPYDPDPLRRAEVVRNLAVRPHLSNEEWHQQYAASRDIPLDFVSWYRDALSYNFEYDLSAALPEDRLVEDLGMYEATYSDVDFDIFEDFENRFGKKLVLDGLEDISTFGELLEMLWQQSMCSSLSNNQ
ncbi:MAG: hypothetical protein CXR31_14060 [Geobacter sp.]|nr:MAG: hypothetical protein CXR31_14060 [Geobacter sp.]